MRFTLMLGMGGYQDYATVARVGPLKLSPVPDQPVPILIGGHSKAALGRAARIGDGWLAANADFATLKSLIEELQAQRRAHGTASKADFQIHGMDQTAATLDDFRCVSDLGVTDACAIPWKVYGNDLSLQQTIDRIRRFADNIIARMN